MISNLTTSAATMAVTSTDRYWRYALLMAFFTIFYNLAEGMVSVWFGVQDDALTLFGFGIDSFIEVMSGVGIFFMVRRIRKNPEAPRTVFEQTALRITGASFYLLAAGLAVTACYTFFTGRKPETTLPGFIISLISIAVMWALVLGKRKIGHVLSSAPILADANCTLVCIYMSLVLLVASLLYQVTGFGFADVIGAAGLIYFSIREGKEALEKAAGMVICRCCHGDGCGEE